MTGAPAFQACASLMKIGLVGLSLLVTMLVTASH